jgi:hypothetical protein
VKILYVSSTPFSGGHLRMAEALAKRGHETRALTPATWEPEIRELGPKRMKDGRAWWIGDQALVGECVEWAEAIHFTYSASLESLGRSDLLGRKPLVWHLATKWKPGFMRHFPGDSAKHYRFVFSAEGWDRYELPPFGWRAVPVLYPIDDPLWLPMPFEKRARRVTMTPRLLTDEWGGKPIPAPRAVPSIQDALAGLPLAVVSGVGHREAMRAKASSWVGIDDVVNPLVHFSGFEYLSLGVPCLNRSDEHMRWQLAAITGGPWPFVDCNLNPLLAEDLKAGGSVAATVRYIFEEARPENVEEKGKEARRWMEKYYSADLMAQRYEELYR